MRPLSIVLIFLVIVIPLMTMNDAKQDIFDQNRELQKQYSDDFQAAVDDAGSYLSRFEAQQLTTAIRYQREKQIAFDTDMLNVFFNNLALKYGIENNPVAIENLKIHMPAMVLFRYNGYVMVTLEDTANPSGKHEIKPVFWPTRPYVYTLNNGNSIYFTLDDQATVYDKKTNQFHQGDYGELQALTNLAPLTDLTVFREVRQNTITKHVEKDLAAAINLHIETVKRLDLNIQFSIPRDAGNQTISDVGFMAFIQGYPMSNGQLFNGYAFGGGSVVQRKGYIGTVSKEGRHVAYGGKCVPGNVERIETLYDEEEAVRKGYFIDDCIRY
ncbi:hypothetical protein M5X06_00070 [Paenibacillus alvei]|uniref:Uncharacterized protein n=1 Tax=Paenibacillus alvei TaxID=44250 RepID=A0ABT4GV91_PAEAL|nr:hypothetical protein [Paenibacillus alvei]MCY9760616.1 hypothetical protein [Paenibacillus alvei]MCY9765230.1 hypothetical protein [Paenibacillus alvei]